MIRRIYKGSGKGQLVFEEYIPNEVHQTKTVRIYAKDLLAEMKLIAIAALFIFGMIFAVPMVRHESVYVLYWTLTAVFSSRVLWKRYRRPKKKSRNRARTATPRH